MKDLSDQEILRFLNSTNIDFDKLVDIASSLALEVMRRRRVEIASRNIRAKTKRYFRV